MRGSSFHPLIVQEKNIGIGTPADGTENRQSAKRRSAFHTAVKTKNGTCKSYPDYNIFTPVAANFSSFPGKPGKNGPEARSLLTFTGICHTIVMKL